MLMSSRLSWIQMNKLLEVQHQRQAGGGWEDGGGNLGRNPRLKIGEQKQLPSPGEWDCKRQGEEVESITKTLRLWHCI